MPNLEPDICRERFAAGRVARLGTIDAEGRAHLVPVVFALDGEVAFSPIDHKPKTTPDLVRARNIARDPRVTLLVDHYEDDWTLLWWVRSRGLGEILERGSAWQTAVDALTVKYPRYRDEPLTERILAISISEWSGWAWTV